MKFLFSLFALFMATNSCNSSKEAVENSNLKNSNKVENTLSGSYIITQIGNNKSISPKLTISFDDELNRVTGFAGCNSFFGGYTAQNNDITFGNIASTKKLCQKEINDLERHLLKTLSMVNTFVIKDNILSFLENDTTLFMATKSIVVNSVVPKKSDIAKDNYNSAITYQSSTKGSFEFINISKSNISFSTDRSLKTIDKYNCEEKDWEGLNTLIEAVDMETFQKLKAPTDKRFTDAAAQATLVIQLGDAEYMTPAFDHGNPPKEIEALVNKVLSLKENTVKK